MNEHPRDSGSPKRRHLRFGLKFLLALIGVVAISLFVTLPMFSNTRFAELTVTHQAITDDNLVQVSFETTMASDSYVSLSCPAPTIAAGDPQLKIPGWPDRRVYHYLGTLDPSQSGGSPDSLTAGFSLRPGDKVRLDSDSPEIDIYNLNANGKEFKMTLRLTNRPS